MTTIDLDGIVGWDITAADIRAALPASGTVELRINSPGGSVHEGIAIYNALRAFKRDGGIVNAAIVGIAASMATYIASVADRLTVEDNAVWMVHNPWTFVLGDHRAMTKAATILCSLRGVLARAYARRSGREQDDILSEMDAETWLYGEEIVSAGYADEVEPAGDGPADRDEALAISMTAFQGMQAKLREQSDPQLDQIAAMLPQNPTAKQPQEPTMTAKTADTAAPPASDSPVDADAIRAEAIATERTRIADITAACAAAKMPELASGLIADGTSADQARAKIINAWAAKGGEEIAHGADDAQDDDFDSLMQAKQSAGMTRANALRAVITEHPAAHRAWLARINAA